MEGILLKQKFLPTFNYTSLKSNNEVHLRRRRFINELTIGNLNKSNTNKLQFQTINEKPVFSSSRSTLKKS